MSDATLINVAAGVLLIIGFVIAYVVYKRGGSDG